MSRSSLPFQATFKQHVMTDSPLKELQALLVMIIEEGKRVTGLAELITSRLGETGNRKKLSEDETVKLACLLSKLEAVKGSVHPLLEEVEETYTTKTSGNMEKKISDPAKFVMTTQIKVTEYLAVLTDIQLFFASVELDHVKSARNSGRSSDGIYSGYDKTTPQKRMCSKNGKWIKLYGCMELTNTETGGLTKYGQLRKDYEKQCDNIILLERERDELLLKIDRLVQ